MLWRCLTLLPPAALALWAGLAGRAPTAAASADKKPAFAREGVAFLQKHCVSCHGAKVKRAELSLHTFKDDASLLKNRKLWANVVHAVKSGEMPLKPRPRPSPDEVETFLAAVKAVFDHAERNAPPDPGQVTIRRLNRAEYNNTIRDLVGVDFNPAEDFPADDIGHGFDNIADVLTLSPVLMERYLSAAEGITERAILAELPAPPVRRMAGRYLEPAQGQDLRWRPLDRRGNQLHTPYRVTLGGEFFFRAHAFATLTEKDVPVKVAVLNGTRELKRFEVTAAKGKPVTLEVKVDLPPGDHRFHVKLLNPDGGPEGRNLHVQWFSLTGPSDTRPESHRKLLAVTPGKGKAEQTREVLTRFANRAYRRPATAGEIDRLVKLVEAATKRGEKWEAGIQLAMQAVLVSPKFLFRVEADERPTEAKPYPLNDYQLASRLSYFLWSTMPDDELFRLAEKKELSKNLDAQVRRMLKDPKAAALVENFAMQWLQLRRLKAHAPDPKLFPDFTERLRAAMIKETELFLGEIVREDRSVLDMIDGRYTYLNYDLAWHYGIVDTVGNRRGQPPAAPGGERIAAARRRGGAAANGGFVRVTLPAGDDRGGLLTQASVLTVTSNPTRTSPVKRGRWVLEQLLGTPPPPPPPDVPELEDDKRALTGSLRQRMEQHRKNPSCANCHAKMDPLGFAFEKYDAIGAFRDKDGEFAIDTSGTLPDGKTFQGPTELKKVLREKKDLFARCLAEKMLTYALGRGLEHYDNKTVDALVAALAKDDYRFSVLVTEIVKSFPFRMRRGKDLSQ